jgi:hypothetical protein
VNTTRRHVSAPDAPLIAPSRSMRGVLWIQARFLWATQAYQASKVSVGSRFRSNQQRSAANQERNSLMIRKENRMDSFQRQVSALRQQLSSESDEDVIDDAEPMPGAAELQRVTAPTPITILAIGDFT